MLIFNREEISNSYKSTDNEILSIESTLSLREFAGHLQNVLNGTEELDHDHSMVHLYRSGPMRQVIHQTTDYAMHDNALYCHTFDQENERGLDEISANRDPLFSEFERFTYGQNHDFIEVPEDDWNLEQLYEDLLDALGVMPTLYAHRELPIKKLQDLSYLGRSLYFPWEMLTTSNRLPEYEDLVFFDQLNPYERSVMVNSRHNPTRLMDVLKAMKQIQGYDKALITEEMVERIAYTTEITNLPDFLSSLTKANLYHEVVEQKDYKALDAAFRVAFRRSPRILPELYEAYRIAYQTNELTAEQIAEIVEKFKLSNIQKVAGYHNLTLLQLAGELNFDEVKQEHLQVFASYIRPEQFLQLQRSGFLTWYQRHKREVKTSDLCNIARHIRELHFDPEMTPKQLLTLKSQVTGWCNAACVAHDYRGKLDFRNAVVAIPGRGLVVEDKAAHIRMRIAKATDARIFTAPIDCHCCQHLAMRRDVEEELAAQNFTSLEAAYAYVEAHYPEDRRLCSEGAGATCVANELTHPLAWITIWEDSLTGDTIAQADTHYVARENTLVYDNIEFVNDGNVKKIYDILAVYAEQSDYDAIHIGTGYNQHMKDIGKRIATKEMVSYTDNVTKEFREAMQRSLYSDYHSDAVKIKQNGQLLLYPKRPMSNFTITREPEDNEPFRYLLHPLSNLFYDRSPDEKRDLISRYEGQNLTTDEMLLIARQEPALLAEIDILPLSVQQAMLYPTDEARMDMEKFQYIRHPDSLLLQNALRQSPSSIRFFDAERTTRESWLTALEQDGSLIEYCPKVFWDEELLATAIRNNPFSIKYAATSLEEPLRSKMINMAVFKKPILAAHFPDIPEYIWIKICEGHGQFGKYCPDQTYRIQKAMIASSPYNIDHIRTPDVRIVEETVRILPSLRYNPRYAAYFHPGMEAGTDNSRVAPVIRSNRPVYHRQEQRTPVTMAFSREQDSHEDDFDLADIL